MKLYPDNIAVKLGFDQIQALLEKNCMSSLGERFVHKLTCSSNSNMVNEWLEQTNEFVDILGGGKSFPQSNYYEIGDFIKRSEVPGQYLDAEELFEIKGVAETIYRIIDFLDANKNEYPRLFSKVEGQEANQDLFRSLDSKIDEKGEIRSNASPELSSIREQIDKSRIRARNSVNKILKQANSLGYTPDGASLTVRDGRMVIPLLAEHKRHIKGFVHDESATGQTVFLEPAEALEINNELRELQYAERREIIRILTELTDLVRENHGYLKSGQVLMGIIDFVRAKAKLARDLDCICPEIGAKPKIDWRLARHPILELSLKEQGKQIVPLNVAMNKKDRIVLISGPNAGGKSVCLKTVGLVQYMLQCGIPVPVAEGSEFGIFDSIFIDIGDDQSIENDLSTYSSHLTHMKHFLKYGNQKTLFLIDEFGTGTEPQIGGAIAEVVLQNLNQNGCFGAITTHYGNLKKTADKANGLINAAMRFDTKKLEPLYELEIGKPGSSFALEIAGKIGLDKGLLNRAKKIAGVTHVQFDKMLNELENEKNQLEKQKKEILQKDKRLSDAIKDYNDLKGFLDKEQKKILDKAKGEASRLIETSNKKIEATIKEIQESKAEKKRVQAAREQLKTESSKLKTVPKSIPTKVEELKVGDRVRLMFSGSVGEIAEIKGKNAEITLGGLKSRVKLTELEKISQSQFEQSTAKKIKKMSGIDLNSKMSSFNPNLDIRGNRAEEVIGKVETFLDEAILLGYGEIKILHGKGHGILREIVRNTLRENPRVAHLADEHVERGGSGITIVTLDH